KSEQQDRGKARPRYGLTEALAHGLSACDRLIRIQAGDRLPQLGRNDLRRQGRAHHQADLARSLDLAIRKINFRFRGGCQTGGLYISDHACDGSPRLSVGSGSNALSDRILAVEIAMN